MTDLAHALVAETAPDELDLFAPTADAFWQDPRGAMRKRRDETLGFGVGEGAEFLTPAVMLVTSQAVRFLCTEMATGLASAASEAIVDRVRSAFKGRQVRATPQPIELTPEQLARLESLLERSAAESGLSEKRARQIAKTFIGNLALLPVRKR